MEQSDSWEPDGHSADKKIPRFLRNPKFHYHHKTHPQDLILSQLHPIHFVKILLVLSSGPFPSGLSTNILYLTDMRYMFCTYHST
jgi:hypothetical protein